jgi:outer membrane protein OmpA-like peptidoglycan-associated protein
MLFLLPGVVSAQTQNGLTSPGEEASLPSYGIKTNLLYDAVTTINLGVEFRTGAKTSLEIPFHYNPWTFNDNRKWKHVLVQPEFRRWLRGTFDGHFFGLHGHYAYYNVGNLPAPFSDYMKAHRFEGWLAGAGISYGYRWNFRNPRWALEATVGVGYAYLDYERYLCETCGEYIDSRTKHYFGPTKAALNLIFGFGNPKQPAEPVSVPQPTPYTPHLMANYIVPAADSVKARSESYSTYLDFETGRWEILPNFRNNASELRGIHELIRRVAEDPNVTITGIRITGYASPEGVWTDNMILSERRTQALKEHINTVYGLPESLFTVRGAGEDWETLDSLVSASRIDGKAEALAVIRGDRDPDLREQRLKGLRNGSVYSYIFREFYPRLRRSDYRIDYTVAAFTVEQGKEVLRSRPGNLSLNEMYLIANTYDPNSPAFNELFEIAARVYPDSDVANINAASAALKRNDLTTAARYLSKVKEHTPTYRNNLGVLLWMQGSREEAVEQFRQAGTQADGNRAEAERYFRSLNRW